MDSKDDLLEKLIKNIHHMFELDEQKKELLYNLIEALTVKNYKEKNPEAKNVVLLSYYAKNEKTKAVDKYKTFECVASDDHRRLNKFQTLFGRAQYRELKMKSYDLTKFIPDKTIATCQKDITKALNN